MLGPSIEFRSVSLTLGNTQILEDVSFDVMAGTIHCIIGANGGGKTSLVRAMLGQMPHTGDITIRWQGDRTVGYVPQNLEFDTTLPVTVLDFVTMACQRRPAFLGSSGGTRQQINNVLEQFGLADKRHYKLGNLSGGERQRTLFAQAFIPKPSLLVLDEPMAGLDEAGAALLLEVIERFVGEGRTVMWINHDIAQVSKVANQLTYINRAVMLNGVPQEVLQSDTAQILFPTLELVQASLDSSGSAQEAS